MLTLLAQTTGNLPDMTNTVNTTASGGLFAVIGSFFLVFLLICLVLLAFNIWMIVDCAVRNESDFSGNNKNMWLILLIVGLIFSFGWIVGIIYFFAVKHKAGKGGNDKPESTDSGNGSTNA